MNYFAYARTALKYGLQHLRLNPNDYVLLPDYICDVVLHPMTQLGIKYKYYAINDNLNPNWDELENIVDETTKAILMVHYFGQPQDIKRFQMFCKEHNLLLIEDNAHGHGGRYNGKQLGTFGDMGISSPSKTLNTFSGGGLWLKDKKFESTSDHLTYPVSLIKRINRRLSITNPALRNFIKKPLKKRPRYENPRAFKEPELPDYAIDSRSAGIIEHTNWNDMRKFRQETYHYWQYFAIDNNLTPVFEKLHPEANPWCFPAYARDQQEAIKWFDWGWENNVRVSSWPSLPVEVLDKHGASYNRWKKLICFGIERYV